MRPARRPPAWVAAALTVAKASALTALVVLPVANAITGPRAGGSLPDGSLADRYQSRLRDQLAAHHCSARPASIAFLRQPSPSALILSPAGEPRLVSFEVGRAVGEGRAPGVLVAVCADRLR